MYECLIVCVCQVCIPSVDVPQRDEHGEGSMSVLQRECMNVCLCVWCVMCVYLVWMCLSGMNEHGKGSMSVLQRKCMNACLCVVCHVCIPSVEVHQRDERCGGKHECIAA